MRDYFRSRSTMQLPSTEYNFRQNHDTSFIAFSMNELKNEKKKGSTDIVVRYIGTYAVRTHITGCRV